MAKKRFDTKKAMGWFIIIVMVLGMGGLFGAGLFSEDGNHQVSSEEYNGFTFYRQYTQWKLTVNGKDYGFNYLPQELENVTLGSDISNWRGSDKVYLAYVPGDTLDSKSFFNLLSAVLYTNNIRPQEACAEEEGCGDIPIIDCENNQGVIFKSGEEFIVHSEGNCVMVEAVDVLELQRATERIIYGFLGVMQ